MAKIYSIEIHGISFGSNAVFGPSTLRKMFGSTLPKQFHICRDGSVSVATVTRYLREQGEIGLKIMQEDSEIIRPNKNQFINN